MGTPSVSVSVSYLYLRYFWQISILLYLSDTGLMYLEYLTEDTFQSIFPNPATFKKKLSYLASCRRGWEQRRRPISHESRCRRTRRSRTGRLPRPTWWRSGRRRGWRCPDFRLYLHCFSFERIRFAFPQCFRLFWKVAKGLPTCHVHELRGKCQLPLSVYVWIFDVRFVPLSLTG